MDGHTVEVDEQAAEDIFNAYEVEYIPADHQLPPPSGSQEEATAEDNWGKWTGFAASFLNHKICPNWEVDQATEEQWAAALAECMEDIFPGGFANIDKWSPWAKLAFATGAWVMCGIDFETMTFKPLQPKKDDEEEEEAPAADDEEKKRERPSGGFKIG